MANLIIPRRGIRTEQPTEMVGIAPYWLTKNPALLCNYGVSHLNLIDGSGSYKGVAATVGVTRHGAGRYSLATSGFNYPDMPFGGNAPISIVAFVAGYSSVGSGVVGQGTEIILRTNAANNGCEFILNSFATNDRVSVVATPRPGGGLLLAGTYGPSSKLRAYANGAMAEVAPTGTYANIASVFDVISTAVGTYGSNVHAVAIFRSELSQADVLNLVANPWQLFAPRTTYLFSVTALANTISLGLVAAQFSAQAYQASADTALGSGAAGVGANSVSPAGVLSTNTAVLPVTSQGAFVSAVQSLQSANVSLNSPDLDYILGALGNAVSLGLASISTTARAITYSTPGGTVHVVPYEFLGDYDIVHCSGNIAVDRSGALIIILR